MDWADGFHRERGRGRRNWKERERREGGKIRKGVGRTRKKGEGAKGGNEEKEGEEEGNWLNSFSNSCLLIRWTCFTLNFFLSITPQPCFPLTFPSLYSSLFRLTLPQSFYQSYISHPMSITPIVLPNPVTLTFLSLRSSYHFLIR